MRELFVVMSLAGNLSHDLRMADDFQSLRARRVRARTCRQRILPDALEAG